MVTVFDDIAAEYETVASLPPTLPGSGGRASGKPGSRIPPGMSEVLDVDEYQRAVSAVDEWALFVAHVLVDEVAGIGSVPDTTPGRLRLAGRWADRIEQHPDVMLRYAIQADAIEHRDAMRSLARRGTRKVKTHSPCLDITCSGQYVAEQEPREEHDWELVCTGCGDRVPSMTFERWGSRAEWVTAEHVARTLGLTVQAVWQRAKRGGWRRMGSGREVRYHREDAGVSLAA